MPKETLSPLGQRVDDLLEEQGRTRAWLQRELGVSRSHLYRILTGKTAVTVEEATAIGAALGVPMARLTADVSEAGQWEPTPDLEPPPSAQGVELEEFVSNMDRIVLTLRNFPSGPVGVRLKIGFLNLVEDVARETGNKLPLEYYRIRKEVQDLER